MVKAETLILALGNPLRGDDGVGAAVLAYLDGHLPAGVAGLDGGTPGLETVLLLQEYRRAIIIDAADMGLQAGSWRRFRPESLRSGSDDLRGTLHSAGLAEALALGAALDILPSDIMIFGIQPAVIGWEPGLSPEMATAVPLVAAAIMDELG